MGEGRYRVLILFRIHISYLQGQSPILQITRSTSHSCNGFNYCNNNSLNDVILDLASFLFYVYYK